MGGMAIFSTKFQFPVLIDLVDGKKRDNSMIQLKVCNCFSSGIGFTCFENKEALNLFFFWQQVCCVFFPMH